MKPFRTVLPTLSKAVLWFVFLTIGVADRSAADMAPPADPVFDALMVEYFKAWTTGGPDVAGKLYAKDADLEFYDLFPLRYQGWSAYRDGVFAAFVDRGIGGSLVPIGHFKLHRVGDTFAWMTLLERYTFKIPNAAESVVDARHTMIWEKRGGKWLIVHEHISTAMPPL